MDHCLDYICEDGRDFPGEHGCVHTNKGNGSGDEPDTAVLADIDFTNGVVDSLEEEVDSNM